MLGDDVFELFLIELSGTRAKEIVLDKLFKHLTELNSAFMLRHAKSEAQP